MQSPAVAKPTETFADQFLPRGRSPTALLRSHDDGLLITQAGRGPALLLSHASEVGKGKVLMDSRLSPTRADPRHDGDVVVLASKDWTGAEEALSRLAHEAVGGTSDHAGSDIFAGLQVTEPSLNATLRPAGPKDGRFPSDRPSPGRRASRALARFLIAAFIGVAATLAWQSYGEAAKQMIASWAQQLGWSISLPAMNPPPSPEIVAEQPSPPAVQASAPDAPQDVPVTQTAPEMVAPTAPVAPSPDLQQLEAMARDLASVRQNVEKLAAGQEQMARDITRLQTAEKDIRRRISAPPPQPAAAPARKPVPMPPSEQSAPQISAAPPPPAPPPPPSRPPMPVH